MAAVDLTAILRVPGRLSINPTNLATAWPHGGTGLGAAARCYVEPSVATEEITAEEWGQQVVESIYLGQSWILGAHLRQWVDDVLTTIWPNTTTGTGGEIIEELSSTTNQPGYLLTGKAVKLLFTPYDEAAHPAVLFYRALPMIEEQARMRLSIIGEFSFPVLFRAIKNTNGKIFQAGFLSDLTVTD